MYIKRNIRMKKQDNTNHVTTTGISNKGAGYLKSTGRSKYNFPRYGEIPAGNYFSTIMDARFMTTSSGKESVEVCYKMIDAVFCYKYVNGILPVDAKPKKHYVKQVYPLDSVYYDAFTDKMGKALNKVNFHIDEIIGITEYISLAYDNSNSNIGGIKDRKPCTLDDFIQADDQDEEAEEWYD